MKEITMSSVNNAPVIIDVEKPEDALRHLANGSRVWYFDSKRDNFYELGGVDSPKDISRIFEELDASPRIIARIS